MSMPAADLRLVEAVRNQDEHGVRTLLNQRIDVNARSSDGSTALLWAAHWNALETAASLIRAGADPNAANDFRMTPLSEACTNGSAAFVDLLVKAGANPNTPIATGVPPIMTCSRSGNANAVRILLAGDADANAKEPSQNQTALMWAAAEHHPDVVRMLIAAKADLGAHTKNGFTALHFAAREGDIVSARLLLAAGVNVDVRSKPNAAPATPPDVDQGNAPAGRRALSATASDGATPLLVATLRAQVPLALFLLEQGADPNIADAGMTPLHWARRRGKTVRRIPYTGSTSRGQESPIDRPNCNWCDRSLPTAQIQTRA
jgi:ankyrin repeat protein